MPSAIFTFRCYMFLFLFKTSPFPTRNAITTAIQPCQSFKLHLACNEKGGYTLLFIGLYRGLPIWRDIWASHGFPSVAVNITPKTNHFSAFLFTKKPAGAYRRRAFMPADKALPDTPTKHCMAP